MDIAVLIPCFNEENTIAEVVESFRATLPEAVVYVCDNNSSDQTAAVASKVGATVIHERQQGKGHAVRRLFSEVSADIYVLVDGDSTYDAAAAGRLIGALKRGRLDMVVGSREAKAGSGAFSASHAWGNRALSWFLNLLFGTQFSDILSGYRVLSRRFVKSFPALSTGFETETELTVHALSLHMPVSELGTAYGARPDDSESKLRTWRDGWRILMTMLSLFKGERPLVFFSIGFAILAGLSLILGYPIVTEYVRTGLVPRFPTAILATGIMLLAFLSLTAGFILETVTRGRREMKRLFYLRESGVTDES